VDVETFCFAYTLIFCKTQTFSLTNLDGTRGVLTKQTPSPIKHDEKRDVKMAYNGYVLAMVGHLKKVSPTFAQMPIEVQMLSLQLSAPLLPIRCCVALFYQVL